MSPESKIPSEKKPGAGEKLLLQILKEQEGLQRVMCAAPDRYPAGAKRDSLIRIAYMLRRLYSVDLHLGKAIKHIYKIEPISTRLDELNNQRTPKDNPELIRLRKKYAELTGREIGNHDLKEGIKRFREITDAYKRSRRRKPPKEESVHIPQNGENPQREAQSVTEDKLTPLEERLFILLYGSNRQNYPRSEQLSNTLRIRKMPGSMAKIGNSLSGHVERLNKKLPDGMKIVHVPSRTKQVLGGYFLTGWVEESTEGPGPHWWEKKTMSPNETTPADTHGQDIDILRMSQQGMTIREIIAETGLTENRVSHLLVSAKLRSGKKF